MIQPLPLLIVERNPSMTAMLQDFFSRQQVDAQAVASVVDAQALLAQRPVPVVLTDLFLPHGDGLTLLQYVRRVVPHTRVVVMGAFLSLELQQKVVNEGAYAFIDKPFRLQRLWQVVRQALQNDASLGISIDNPHGGVPPEK